MWKLTNKDEEYLNAIESLSHEEIKKIPKGSKNAVFIPLMSDEEAEKYLHDRDPFWQKINRKLNELIQ